MRAFFIRAATPADAPALLEIYRPYVEQTAITFEYDVPDPAEFAGRVASTLERYPYLVAERDGELLGYAYAGPFKARAAYGWAVETSIYVRQGEGRHGLGRALYQALERVLAAQHILNVNACIAYPEREDEYLTRDSVAFHQRMGYRLAGKFHQCGRKFGRWYHMVWMEKMLGPHLEEQPPMIPFSRMERAEIQRLLKGSASE